jgi:hypothetical protein
MKSTISPQLVLSMFLLSLAGVGAASAAEATADGQEQARVLLGGRNLTVGHTRSRTATPPATTALVTVKSTASAVEPAVDGQELARLLLVGKGSPFKQPKSRGALRSAAALPSVGSTASASDPQEQARRMILGS